MNTAKRTVHPADQPLKPAVALVSTSLLMVLALAGTYLLGMLTAGQIAPQLLVTVVLALALVVAMLGLASFVLAVVVLAKGGGKLRLGAALMVAAALLGFVFSFSVSGNVSQMPDAAVAVSNVFSVLEVVLEVFRAIVMIAGIVLLVLGIRQTRRERAELAQG